MDSVDHLASEYLRHEQLYREGRAEISDIEFDSMQEKLARLAPNHPVFAVVESGRRLLSLGNQPVESWISRVSFKSDLPFFIVQPKIDGVAIALRYVDGRLAKAWTRKGSDKTSQLRLVGSVPSTLPIKETVEIRGELFAPRVDASRSQRLAAGLLRRKAPKHAEGLSFCAFEILNRDPEIDPDESCILDTLGSWGFLTPPTHHVNEIDEIKHIHNAWLDGNFYSLDFPSDGIVLKVNDRYEQRVMGASSVAPNWALAIKSVWKNVY